MNHSNFHYLLLVALLLTQCFKIKVLKWILVASTINEATHLFTLWSFLVCFGCLKLYSKVSRVVSTEDCGPLPDFSLVLGVLSNPWYFWVCRCVAHVAASVFSDTLPVHCASSCPNFSHSVWTLVVLGSIHNLILNLLVPGGTETPTSRLLMLQYRLSHFSSLILFSWVFLCSVNLSKVLSILCLQNIIWFWHPIVMKT